MNKIPPNEASAEQVKEFIDAVESVNEYTSLHGLAEVTWNQIMACFHCESSSMSPQKGDPQSIPMNCHNESSQAFQRYYSSKPGIAPIHSFPGVNPNLIVGPIPWEIAFRGCSSFKLRSGEPIISTSQASKLIPTDSLLRKQNPASIYADFKSTELVQSPTFNTVQFLSAHENFVNAEEAKAKLK